MLPADQGGDPELFYEFALAERLGMTHAELEHRISLREIGMWQGYDHARLVNAGHVQQQIEVSRGR